MNAQEAKKLAQDTVDSVLEKELSEVLQDIQKAAKDGKFYCTTWGALSRPLTKTLQSMGYETDVSYEGQKSCTTIKW